MTIISKEVYGKSESGSIDKNGSRTLVRTFHVYDDGGATVTLQGALSVATLPSAGDVITAGGDDGGFSRVQGSLAVWSVSFEYSSSVVVIGDTIPDEMSGGVRATTRGVYRAGSSMSPAGSGTNLPKNDIGGDRVDSGGVKTSITHPQATLSIRTHRVEQPLISEFHGLVGKRNEGQYQGGVIGSVLFVGISYSKNTSTNIWVLDYEFAFDPKTFHADQVARTGADGTVDTEKDPNYSDGGFTAQHVFWVQPFEKVSFAGFP